jgi:hypothetical protein
MEGGAVNPRCTGFCTGGGAHPKGHPVTEPEDVLFMRGLLERLGRPEPLSDAASVSLLYRRGYGYHAIADALGISHEEAYMILTTPARP